MGECGFPFHHPLAPVREPYYCRNSVTPVVVVVVPVGWAEVGKTFPCCCGETVVNPVGFSISSVHQHLSCPSGR